MILQKNCYLTILVFNILSILGTCTSLIEKLASIVIGKFIFGFSVGVLNVAGPKMLDETVPVDLLGAFGIATNVYICFGIGLATLIGVGLPKDGDIEGYIQDDFWRVVYGFPLLFCLLQNIAFLFFLQEDSILFSIKNGNDNDAIKLIKRVYHKDEDHSKIL